MLIMETAYKTFPYSSMVTDQNENYVSYYDSFTTGAGYLDLKAALAAINDIPDDGNALSPIANLKIAPAATSHSLWSFLGVGRCRRTLRLGVLAPLGALVLSGEPDRSVWGAGGGVASESVTALGDR